MRQLTFISYPIHRTIARPVVLPSIKASLHPVYDVAAVSTYIAFWTQGYWLGENRTDVEITAVVLALLWNTFMAYDIAIYYYLWAIGLSSFVWKKTMLEGGNSDALHKAQVATQLGGYMAFVLLVFDAIDLFCGLEKIL